MMPSDAGAASGTVTMFTGSAPPAAALPSTEPATLPKVCSRADMRWNASRLSRLRAEAELVDIGLGQRLQPEFRMLGGELCELACSSPRALRHRRRAPGSPASCRSAGGCGLQRTCAPSIRARPRASELPKSRPARQAASKLSPKVAGRSSAMCWSGKCATGLLVALEDVEAHGCPPPLLSRPPPPGRRRNSRTVGAGAVPAAAVPARDRRRPAAAKVEHERDRRHRAGWPLSWTAYVGRVAIVVQHARGSRPSPMVSSFAPPRRYSER